MSRESRSRNFSLIVPLSQLATATAPSFAINRLRVVGLSRRVLNKNELRSYIALSLSISSCPPIPFTLQLCSLLLFRFFTASRSFGSVSCTHTRQLFELSTSLDSIRQHVVVITSFPETAGLSLCNSRLPRDFVSLRCAN